ncbi:two-component sensor histidine kinase [Longispora fulva]|uniref:histidine kinase n=1 Tax=Longispora fulva TaxID=619741 RepID=A0A8J7KWP4_9ACTN|nr:histidine kinase [Longispora fulva]MBG6136802.1 signal transduction histidine kinase [Longispora fulva]GIG59973.1 two-component sensor histidine kinase [Longispora fulva]
MTGEGATETRRLLAALRELPGVLREDLWTTAVDPLPPLRPRWIARLPHVLVVLFAVVAFITEGASLSAHQLGAPDMDTGLLLIGAACVALVVGTVRPAAAWWAVTFTVVIGAWVTESKMPPDTVFPLVMTTEYGHAIGSTNPVFPWTFPALAVHAAVLFLLALRVRPRSAVAALAISVLLGQLCVAFGSPGRNSDVGKAIVVLGAAVVLGTAMRGRRVARGQLLVQAGLTAEERGRRTLLEERSRIARELHDVVAHHMSVISIQAQVTPHLVKDPPQELLDNAAGIRRNAVEALNELRRVLGVLRSEESPAEDAPQPTLDRLDELVRNVRAAGLTVTAVTHGEPRPLSPGVELTAYRIVQEALSNAMRHAPGAPVLVGVTYHPNNLTVWVANTAPDRPAPPSSGAGHGLLGMRERTSMLGGGLTAGPTPDGGYEVTAFLPTRPTPEDTP